MMMTMMVMVMMRLTMSRLCFELRLFSRLDRALHDDDHDDDDGDDGFYVYVPSLPPSLPWPDSTEDGIVEVCEGDQGDNVKKS